MKEIEVRREEEKRGGFIREGTGASCLLGEKLHLLKRVST